MKMKLDAVTSERLLGFADQFMEDWEQNEGKTDVECQIRRQEYDVMRPVWAHAPLLLDLLHAVISESDGEIAKHLPRSLNWAISTVLATPDLKRVLKENL